jgi:DNA end-binding protein Ku
VPEREDPIESVDEEDVVTRSFWSGTITFGLVSIPVALYAANRARGVSLRMVSPEGHPLGRRYFTSRDDKELDADDIVRGYEIEKDRFVVVDDDELERLAPERTRDIDVRRFVKVEDVDPMYFERAYYLVPAGNSTKAYRLLAQVMEETGRAGIATFVMRAKEYLVAIMAENGILRAETLRFADELRSPADVGLPEPAKPAPAAVRKIEKEIGKRAEAHLDRKELVDHSADRLRKLAQRKLRAGEDVVHVDEDGGSDEDGGPADVIDLMEILKRRLAVADAEEGGAAGASDDDEAPARGGKSASKAKSPARRGGTSKAKAPARSGKASKTSKAKTSARSGEGKLDGSSKEELYARAQELDIPGRSGMSKDELIKAIRRSA